MAEAAQPDRPTEPPFPGRLPPPCSTDRRRGSRSFPPDPAQHLALPRRRRRDKAATRSPLASSATPLPSPPLPIPLLSDPFSPSRPARSPPSPRLHRGHCDPQAPPKCPFGSPSSATSCPNTSLSWEASERSLPPRLRPPSALGHRRHLRLRPPRVFPGHLCNASELPPLLLLAVYSYASASFFPAVFESRRHRRAPRRATLTGARARALDSAQQRRGRP